MEPICQERSLAVIGEIATTHAEQIRTGEALSEVLARTLSLEAQLQQIAEQIKPLEERQAQIDDDHHYLVECNRRGFWYYTFSARCLRLGWREEFEGGFWHDVDELADIRRQKDAKLVERAQLTEERGHRVKEAGAARERVTQLEADRRRLELVDRAARAAATNLSNIALFWSQAEIIIRQRLAVDIEMLRDLLPRLDKIAEAQDFDDFEEQDIRSLRDTMLDFSSSVDTGRNFLASDFSC